MKKKIIYKIGGILLAASVLFTSVPVKGAVTLSGNEMQMEHTDVEAREEENMEESLTEPVDIMAFDWKNATDEEINHVLGCTDWFQIGRWLRNMSKEDYCEVLGRETVLKEYTTIYPAQEADENGKVSDEDVIYTPYYQYAVDFYDGRRGWTRASYPSKASGYWTVDFVNAATKERKTLTIKVSEINTTAKITKQQKVTVATTLSGSDWIQVNCNETYNNLYASQSSSIFANAHVYFSYVKPAGYTASVSYEHANTTALHKIYWAPSTYGKSHRDIFDSSTFKLTDASNRKVYLETDFGNYNSSSYRGTVNLLSIVHMFANAGVGTKGDTVFAPGNSVKQVITLSPINYNVNYNGNGATSGSVSAQNCKYATTYTTQGNGYTRSYTITYNGNGGAPAVPSQTVNYLFTGWGLNNAAVANYKAGQNYSNLTATANGNVTMYAIWTPTGVRLPTATRTGYQFAGWNIGAAGAAYTPFSNITAIANWKANTDTPYKVVYWKESAESGGYIVGETEICYGTTDASVSVKAPAMDGYQTPEAQTAIIKGDGSTVVNFYYSLKPEMKNITYYVEHYIKTMPNGEYMLYKKEENRTKFGTVVSPPLNKEAIGKVNAVSGCYCKEPALQTVTVWEPLTIQYYYDCLKKEEIIAKTSDLNVSQINEIAKRLAAGLSFSLDLNGATYEIMQNEDGSLGIKFIFTNESRIMIPDVVTIGDKVYRITEIYEKAFKDNTRLKEVEVSANISKIGASAFEGCGALEKITFHEGMITIGDRAFYGCQSLAGFETPATLQTIGNCAFQNCTSLKKVTLNSGLVTIGRKAFYNCSGLKKIQIPQTVLKIGGYAFGKCVKLQTAAFAPQCQLLSMGTGTFYKCKLLKKISLPNKLSAIPGKCFYGCKALKKATIGEAVTKISRNAFCNCKSLTKVTIPSRVQTIGEKAFYNCTKLKKVTIKSKAITSVGAKAFKQCKKNIRFLVPKSRKNAYQKLFEGKY